jgi:NPCBM-associated, NEW3 domain of alpha-galactosidase/Metallo-peptidase family M12B Reprolysin-like
VRVKGRRSNNVLSVAAAAAETLETLSSPILPDSFGAQKMLVILVNFQDSTAPDFTLADVQPVIDATNQFYLENSFGQTWFDADIVGSYTIAQSSTVCNWDTTATLAEQAAAAHGVDISIYRRFVYVFPHNACSSAGKGNVGGNPSRGWMHATLKPQVWIHEIGHNFGLFHSHMQMCDSAGCSVEEYGDMDIMGSDPSAHFNAFQKERLGWLDYDDGVHVMPPVTTITADGIYSLGIYEAQDLNPKALKIVKAGDPTGEKTVYYYLQYREPIWQDYPSGFAMLRSGTHADPNSSVLLDLAPTASAAMGIFNTGDRYTDALGNSITLLSQNRTNATFAISLAPFPCAASDPTVTFSPQESQSLAPGGSLIYTVTVTNRFGASCAMSDVFDLSATAPLGGSASLENTRLTIPPGESAQTALTVSARGSVQQNGNYTFAVTAKTSDPLYTGNATGTVYIPACKEIPSVVFTPSTLQTIAAGSSFVYSVNVKNNNDPVCLPVYTIAVSVPAGWTALNAPSLTVAAGSTAATTIEIVSPATAAQGIYSYSIDIMNSAGTGWGAVGFVSVASCTRSNPSVAVSESVWNSAVATYTATITNTDDARCGPSTFNLSATLPSGWSMSPPASNLIIAPGASASATFQLSLPVGSGDGIYNFTVRATNPNAPTYTTSTPSFVACCSGDLAVAIKGSKSIYKRGAAVSMSIIVTKAGSAVSGATVNGEIVQSGLVLGRFNAVTGKSGAAKLKYQLPRNGTSGQYRINTAAFQGQSAGSKSIAFLVQ